MHVPWTRVWKRGTEESSPCMLEKNSWISMEGQVIETSHIDSQPWLWMTSGRLVSAKFAKMTRCSEWTPRREKFSEKSFWASSSRNRIWEGVGSEEDDAPERKGFWDGVDLHYGSIDITNVNEKREREERDNQKSSKQFKYIEIY